MCVLKNPVTRAYWTCFFDKVIIYYLKSVKRLWLTKRKKDIEKKIAKKDWEKKIEKKEIDKKIEKKDIEKKDRETQVSSLLYTVFTNFHGGLSMWSTFLKL